MRFISFDRWVGLFLKLRMVEVKEPCSLALHATAANIEDKRGVFILFCQIVQPKNRSEISAWDTNLHLS
jgi:hypothetical protein